MTTEEKAQAYDEVLNKLRRFMAQGVDPLITRADVQDFFPELKESEDERIRRDIIRYLKKTSPAIGENIEKMLAWLEKQGEFYTKRDVDNAYIEGMAFAKDELEKQGKTSPILANSAKTCKDEQKPTDEEIKTLLRTEYEKGRADAIAEMQNLAWSEEDEEFLRRAINATKDAYPITAKWLKSLKSRVQSKQEWNKEDESYLNTTIAYLKDAKEFKKSAENCINWLKSLRPQPKKEWSEEDIRNIENIDSVLFYDKDLPEDTCVRLRNWLKSLKERIGG